MTECKFKTRHGRCDQPVRLVRDPSMPSICEPYNGKDKSNGWGVFYSVMDHPYGLCDWHLRCQVTGTDPRPSFGQGVLEGGSGVEKARALIGKML
jgi:hypothetical protein